MTKEKKLIIRKRFIKIGIAIIAVILLLLAFRSFMQYQIYQEAKRNYAISEIQRVNLDGKDQSILVQSKKKDLPILIFIHGGPQSPILYGEGYRGDFPELSEHFTVVSWDQYGCGKNFIEDTESVNMDGIVNMICDLVREMKKTYPGQKVYLYGYSNGTILTMETAKIMGTELAGIINNGPITSLRDAKKIAVEALGEANLSNKEKEKLNKLSQSDTAENFIGIEGMMVFNTNRQLYWKELSNNTELLRKDLRALISPDYNLLEVYYAYYSLIYGESSYKALKEDYYEADIKEILENTSVPILICQSEGDIYGSQSYFEDLAAKRENISYVNIERCAHLPTNTGFDQLEQLTIDFAEKH